MTTFDATSIALHMSIVYGGDLGDARTLEHEVRFSLFGAPETQVIAIVQGDPVRPPRVLRYVRRSDLDLKQPLLDQIVLMCFSRLAEQLILQNTGAQTAQVRENADWLLRRFSKGDTDLVSSALSRYSPAAQPALKTRR